MVGTHIIHDDNVCPGQSWYQHCFQIFSKTFLCCPSLINSVVCFSVQPHRGQYRCITWCIDRRAVYSTFILWGTCIMPCHICVDTTFIEEHQMFCVVPLYMFSPVFPFLPDIGDAPVPKHAGISFYKHTQASRQLCARFHH